MSRCLPLLLAASVLGAQEYGPGLEQNHVVLGFSAPLGEASRNLDLGWLAGVGGTYWFTPTWGLHLEGQLNRFTLSDRLLKELGPATSGRGELYALLFHAAWRPGGSPGHGPYLLLGGGGAYRRIEVIQKTPTAVPQGQGWVGVAPGELPATEYTSSRPACSVALGWEGSLRRGGNLFIELRYLRVFTRGGAMDLVPVVVGTRF